MTVEVLFWNCIGVAVLIAAAVSVKLYTRLQEKADRQRQRDLKEDYREAVRKWEEQESRVEQERDLRNHAALKLLEEHAEVVDRFLRIAERQVSTLDEYGDENWDVLAKEISRCIAKITARASFVPDRAHLRSELESRFRAFHKEQSKRQRQLEELQRMAGDEFENYLMRLLRQLGCSVSGTPRTGDKGGDILARFNDRIIVIQAKRSRAPVGIGAIQEVAAAVAYYGGTEAWVVTNSTFTKAASELANRNAIALIAGVDLHRIDQLLHGSKSTDSISSAPEQPSSAVETHAVTDASQLNPEKKWWTGEVTDKQIALLWKIAPDLRSGFSDVSGFGSMLRGRYNAGQASVLISQYLTNFKC